MRRLVLAASLVVTAAAHAQGYPSKPLRVVSSAASGSPGDITLRLVAPRAGAALGQPMVVETKGGGGGQIAAQDVIRAGADGYTLLYSSSMIASSRYLLKNVTLDMLRDLAAVSMSARGNNVLALHSSVPARTLKELVDYAKKNPGKLSFSSNGIGSSLHLQFIGFMLSSGTELFHVPYGSANEGLRNNDFLTGRIALSLIPYSTMRAALDSGQVRALAMLGEARYKRLPGVPAVNELFPDYRFTLGFWGFFAPAGVPPAAVARVSGEIQKGLRDAEVVSRLEAIDVEAVGNTPEQFAAYLKVYEANVVALVKASGLQPQ